MGIGDEIMAAGVAQSMGAPVAIVDAAGRPRSHPIWEGNPAIDPTSDLHLADYPGQRGYMLRWDDGPRAVFNPTYRVMNHPGRIYVPDAARAWARDHIPEGCTIIEPIVRRPSSMGKDWGVDNWRALVERLDGHNLIQLGEDGGREMLATWVKTPTMWHAAAAVERAGLVLCGEGGLHHMAGALRVPAVVYFGGFTPPSMTGYDWHVNVYADIPGSPCGRYDHCTHCDEARRAISVDDMARAVVQITHARR